jgi:membrane protein required for colicin V production
MSFPIDIIFLAIILVFAIVSAIKGFINAIFNKLCWILGLVGAFLFYNMLSGPMMGLVKNPLAANILSFLVIFIVVFLFIKIIQTILSKVFDGEIMKGLDRSLGFFFGFVEGLVVVYVFIFIVLKQPWFPQPKFLEGSFFVRIFDHVINYVPIGHSNSGELA